MLLTQLQILFDYVATFDGILTDELVHGCLELTRSVVSFIYPSNYNPDDSFEVEAFDKITPNSLLAPDHSEEVWGGYKLNYPAIYVILEGKLSEAYDDYFLLTNKYPDRLALEGDLVCSEYELVQYLLDWSTFYQQYPHFFEEEITINHLRRGLYLYANFIRSDPQPNFTEEDYIPQENDDFFSSQEFEDFMRNLEAKVDGFNKDNYLIDYFDDEDGNG